MSVSARTDSPPASVAPSRPSTPRVAFDPGLCMYHMRPSPELTTTQRRCQRPWRDRFSSQPM